MNLIKSYTRCYITVSQQNIIHNLKTIKALSPSRNVLAMVKGNGYGHGVEVVTQALKEKVGYFGVADAQEAIYVRRFDKKTPIVITSGVWHENQVKFCIKKQAIPIINDPSQIKILIKAGYFDFFDAVFIKINTGMNRLGMTLDNAKKVYKKINRKYPAVSFVIMSHFSSAEDVDNAQTQNQEIKNIQIEEVFHDKNNIRFSFCNSAAVLNKININQGDIIRPGLALYGVNICNNINLKATMSFYAHIIAINKVKAGECVGYNESWTVTKDSMIAVVAAGYADGYPHIAANGTPVYINGYKCPLIGRVSMDMLTVDISSIKRKVKVGDKVELWGENNNVFDVSKFLNISPYSLLCGITKRVRKFLI